MKAQTNKEALVEDDGAAPNEFDASTIPNESREPLPPKPVLNVAYFGDSGRSAPVPPADQADFARPILVADPLPKHRVAPTPESTPLEGPHKIEEDTSTTLQASPLREGQADPDLVLGVMATVPKGQLGPLGIPIDASD
ncbi:hypothetical protein BN14_03751 [Rhizoctonia solani AG-1 IB]|uniref:Uncharacterized protein n=1 Tax=Thanatephorus cucumeris (strain AG1-IB / isolate 7/3/14) TaxID=1108050 RepID=M5C1M0_THACB|nr:hypothetical protein BN14_03751 [Rhizoctonia solani AG-1 IB]